MACKHICIVIFLFVVIVQEITGERCSPGETKQVDCNRCRCLADGRGFACTRRFCLPQERQNSGHRARRQAGECYPGQIRQIDCNSCRCVRGGAWACTRRACLNPRPKRDFEFTCTPGETFAKECNTCRCTGDGRNAICTLKNCAPLAVATTDENVTV